MKGRVNEFTWNGIAQNAWEIHACLRERDEPKAKSIQERRAETKEKKSTRKVKTGHAKRRGESRLQKKTAVNPRLEAMIKQGKKCTYCKGKGRNCFLPKQGTNHSKCHYCTYGHKECHFPEDNGRGKPNFVLLTIKTDLVCQEDEKRDDQPVSMVEKTQARIELEENIARGLRCQACVKANRPCEAYEDKVKMIRCILCTERRTVCKFPPPEGDGLSQEEGDGGEPVTLMI